MAQRKGLHRLLEMPLIYNFVQKLFFHQETASSWSKIIGNHENKVILDVGCGPGKDAYYFRTSKKYIGIDVSKAYIESAKKNYSEYGDFYCCPIDKIDELPLESVDLVIVKGLFHHLPDATIEEFLAAIKSKMSANGYICSLDATFVDNSKLPNLVASMDRGMFVRSIDGLVEIISRHMDIKEQQVVKQSFPPYQRILLKIANRQA